MFLYVSVLHLRPDRRSKISRDKTFAILNLFNCLTAQKNIKVQLVTIVAIKIHPIVHMATIVTIQKMLNFTMSSWTLS